jgi:hypothetical protein
MVDDKCENPLREKPGSAGFDHQQVGKHMLPSRLIGCLPNYDAGLMRDF